MTTAQMPAGSSQREFERLAALETDDCVIWPHAKAGQRGYGQAYIDGRQVYCHREALARRHPPTPERPDALHGSCNNPACMNYRHLRWGTSTENHLDQHRDGTAPVGERNPMARLNPDAVSSIRGSYATGTRTQRQLAADHGVSVMTINRAIRRESWTSVG